LTDETKARLVDLDQQLVGLDDIALAHENLGDQPAVDALQDLHLFRRNDLALAAGDFVELRHGRPQDEQRHDNADAAQQDART
jgi:hypothetical protein